MFENILGQSAAEQLIGDISHNSLAPAMLFHGLQGSGKGSAALELGRVISCEKDASWNCSCSACAAHRLLLHPDMLCLGSRLFSAEIAASCDAYLREKASPSSKILLTRSVRKLLARFNPVLWEDEPKFSKLSPLVLSLEDQLDELNGDESQEDAVLQKRITSVTKDAYKLESDGIAGSIPIEQVRKAAWWSRLAPAGRGKFLLMENAETMKEGARNSLLKLLEEPPQTVHIVLTCSRPQAMLATILSRLRPYRFNPRSVQTEKEIIRRVFRNEKFDPAQTAQPGTPGSLVKTYLDSFLPVSTDVLTNLAAFFAASVAYKTALILKRKGNQNLPEELVVLGKYSASLAEQAGFEKTKECKEAAAVVMEGTHNFEIRALFSRFLGCLLSIVGQSLKSAPSHSSSVIGLMETWRTCAQDAETATMVYNQNISMALERLFISLAGSMAE